MQLLSDRLPQNLQSLSTLIRINHDMSKGKKKKSLVRETRPYLKDGANPKHFFKI